MFWRSSRIQELEARAAAIDKSQAIIEFKMDGTILWANENFLRAVGYTLAEIEGKHHTLFVDPQERDGNDYRLFWQRLNRGDYQVAEYRRIGKGGKEIWLQATYNPVFDRHGKTVKVVKFATDMTEAKLRAADMAGQIAAIGKSQGVIEFQLDGTIITANENFLQAIGYSLAEVRGKHHRMFVTPEERDSAAYREFWQRLNRGAYQAAEYKRIGKGGREVWIQATYNPILDLGGRPIKIVKFATDITAAKARAADYESQISAIAKSQAVVEFKLDGTIVTANENFLRSVGYSLGEIQGKHHSMFVAKDERDGAAYRQFWSDLARGAYQSGEYRRVGKSAREIWIQGSYNPIFDLGGRPVKVVKFATDITEQVLRRRKNEYIGAIVESVAAGTEELNASAAEIAQSMTKSRETADTAVERVRSADTATVRLADAAQSMNGILSLITNITSQINLLALNATIEAARAGEAGRGFAVVATEVKNLAAQARSATDEIAQEINGMREISQTVVDGLGTIRQSIELVRDYITAAASAVQQQSGVTAEMSTSMQRAATEANSLR